jgi:hypothetical protein
VIGKPEGNRPLGRSIHRCEDGFKTYLKEERSEGVDGFIWLRIGDSLLNSVMNLQYL